MTHFFRCLSWLLFCASTQAQGAEDSLANSERAERARIETQRQQVVERFALEEQSCTAKFAVTDCLQSVKARKREALADLHRQETSLNDAKRRRLGSLELERTEIKLRDAVVSDSPAGKASAGERMDRKTLQKAQTQAQREADAQTRSQEQAQKRKQFADQQAQRDAKAGLAAKKQREHQEKLSQAAQHKADLLARQKKKSEPGAKPLPDPP
jgi:hypothetical protein